MVDKGKVFFFGQAKILDIQDWMRQGSLRGKGSQDPNDDPLSGFLDPFILLKIYLSPN